MNFYNDLGMNNFGLIENATKSKYTNIINIICGVLLLILIVILIVCLFKNNDNFKDEKPHMYLVVRNGCGYASKTLEYEDGTIFEQFCIWNSYHINCNLEDEIVFRHYCNDSYYILI